MIVKNLALVPTWC